MGSLFDVKINIARGANLVGGSSGGDFVQEVRAAAGIDRLIGEYVSLKTSGRKLKGLCPFHDEKTPSFTVDPEKGLFYCFGCQVGGDVFKFYMLHENAQFPDALRELAQRFGVPIPQHQGGSSGEQTRLREMHREAAAFFRSSLASGAGATASRYLARRGLGTDTVQHLKIGYAQDSWDALKSRLRQAGYREEELLKAGLTVPRKDGRGSYDRFRDRLMFPIEQAGGGVIGFGGRILGEGEPKYLNSPETPLFQKGRHFYGLSWSRDAIREADRVIIVEGYTDFASLWQAGVRNVVAVLGTSFTPEHARLLARYTHRAVINFDADRAGRSAADRAVTVLMEHDFELRVLELPDGQDPDGHVRAAGAEAYLKLAAGAPSFIEYVISSACAGRDITTPEAKAQAVADILPRLADLNNRVLLAAAMARIAQRLDLKEADLRAEFRRVAPALRRGEAPPAPARPRPARNCTLAERQLMQLLLTCSDVRREVAATAREEELRDLPAGQIIMVLLNQERAGHEVTVEGLQALLEKEDQARLLAAVMEDFPGLVAADWEESWRIIQKENLEKESRILQRQLAQSMEEGGDTTDVERLLRRKLEVRRLIETL